MNRFTLQMLVLGDDINGASPETLSYLAPEIYTESIPDASWPLIV
jgi:hypothetical protein